MLNSFTGLHYHLTEDQVLELLQAFGKVKAFHLVKNDPESLTSKGYCFVEYSDPNVTQVAVIGLNGMDLGGGKVLTARVAGERSDAIMPATSTLAASMSAAPPAPAAPRPDAIIIGGYDVEAIVDAAMGLRPMPTAPMHVDQFGVPITRANASILAPVPGLPMPPPTMAAMPMATTPSGLPPGSSALDIANAALDAAFGASGGAPPSAPSVTRMLVLHNMVTDGDLVADGEYRALLDEVQEECAKYGNLLGMKVPRQASSDVHPTAIRKIFLEYASVQDAAAAERELAGRQFGPNVVTVSRILVFMLLIRVFCLMFLQIINFLCCMQASYFPEAEYLAGRLR
jgi:splicing factor U2AF subunit